MATQNKVGNIITPQDPIKRPARVDRDSIGTGTSDMVPGHRTVLSEPFSKVEKQSGGK